LVNAAVTTASMGTVARFTPFHFAAEFDHSQSADYPMKGKMTFVSDTQGANHVANLAEIP
jgi:hypothetical protein